MTARGVDVAVIVAEIPLGDTSVAVSVLVPAVGPSFHNGTVTVPSIEDVEVAEELAKLPPPLVTANTTCSPGRGLPSASRILTMRVPVGFTIEPAGALSPDPFRTTMLTAFPGKVDAGVPEGSAVADGVAVELVGVAEGVEADAGVPEGSAVADGVAVELVGVAEGVEADVGFAASPFTTMAALDAGTSAGDDSAPAVQPAVDIATTMRPGRARAHHLKRDMGLASRHEGQT